MGRNLGQCEELGRRRRVVGRRDHTIERRGVRLEHQGDGHRRIAIGGVLVAPAAPGDEHGDEHRAREPADVVIRGRNPGSLAPHAAGPGDGRRSTPTGKRSLWSDYHHKGSGHSL
jgi:hypothetical protein